MAVIQTERLTPAFAVESGRSIDYHREKESGFTSEAKMSRNEKVTLNPEN